MNKRLVSILSHRAFISSFRFVKMGYGNKPKLDNYMILDGIEGCMRYCTRHDDIHRAGTARWISPWQVQYILIQPEIKPSNIIIIIII